LRNLKPQLKKANSSHHKIPDGPETLASTILKVMKTLMASLRSRARIPALVLLLAILAPLFVAVLPAPAISAEQQLLADIAASYCSDHGQQQPTDHNLPADHHQCCILCAAPAHVLAPGDATLIIEAALERFKQPKQQAALATILDGAPALEWASPRGPPTHLPV
jgi:hypothetical protein